MPRTRHASPASGVAPRSPAPAPSPASGTWDRDGLEARIGHRFRHPELLRQACTHRSWHAGQAPERDPDYERLEFLGDAVLGLRVSERLLQAYPASSEGHLSRLRSWLVSARHLAAAAARLELGGYVRLGKGEQAGRGQERLLANVMEAIMGALYLDRDFQAAARFIDEHLLGATLETVTPDHLHEFAYKSALQEWTHAQGQPLPHYRVVSASGPEHGKLFQVEVTMAGLYSGQAMGHSKKEAEQRAARGALLHLGILPPDPLP